MNTRINRQEQKSDSTLTPDMATQPPSQSVNDIGVIGNGLIVSNPTPIDIDDNSSTSPYPSTINISGQTGTISKVKVQLNGFSHAYPDDLDLLLVGPQGQKVMLMSDAGGDFSGSFNNVNLTFDDAANLSLPDETQITSGIYKPSDYESGDVLASPAPTGPYSTSLSAFNGTNSNGTWSLYVNDDYLGDAGGTLNSWSLEILDTNDTVVSLSVAPASVVEDTGNNLVYTFNRTGSTTNPLTVNFNVGGTGTLNTDYTQSGAASFNGNTGSITFAAGSSTASLNITPTIDATVEQNETIELSLVSGNGYFADSSSPVIGTISDDDSSGTTTLNDSDQGWYDSTGYHDSTNSNYLVGEVNFGNEYNYQNFFVFDVPTNLGGNILKAELKVNTYEVATNSTSETYQLNAVTTPISTLTAGGYGLTSVYNDLGDGTVYGSRDFTSADNYQSVFIPLNSDFVNALVAAQGSQIALGGKITTLDNILNNEGIFGYSGEYPGTDAQLVLSYAPANKVGISINDVTVVEGQNNSASFVVKLSEASANQVKVQYTTSNDTALAGSDYTTKTGTLTFNPGQVSKLVSIPIINNNLSEADENFKVTLSNPNVNGYILDGQGVGTISDTLSSFITTTLPAAIENLTLTGTNAINGTGNANGNLITGNSSNNTLNGLAGNDTINGGAGNDTINGGAGNDTFAFAVSSNQGSDKIVETSTGGVDTLDFSGTTSSVKVNLGLTSLQTPVTSNLKLTLSATNVIENATGGDGNDKLIGNSLNNLLKGRSGNDNLIGGTGNDNLIGGSGDDVLVGGTGNDSFSYNTGKAFLLSDLGNDIISDFSSTDKVVLSKTTFTALASLVGNGLTAADFAVVNDDDNVATSSAKIVYTKNSNSLYYNQNGVTAGLGTGGEFATLITEPVLTAASFTVIA